MENHGCRRKKRRKKGWERIMGFGRLFIGRVGQKRFGGHKCSQKTW